MIDEKTLSQINMGKTAGVCLEWMSPLFDEQSRNVLASLMSNFRQGKFDQASMAAGIAQLCALEDLKNRLQSMSKIGNAATKRLEGEIDGN